MSELTPTTRALLEAAKTDAPSAAARNRIWGGVSVAAGLGGVGASVTAGSLASNSGAAGAGGAGAGGAAATVAASKLLAIGALLGSTVTVGVAIAVLRIATGTPLAVGPTQGETRVEATAAAPQEAAPRGARTMVRERSAPSVLAAAPERSSGVSAASPAATSTDPARGKPMSPGVASAPPAAAAPRGHPAIREAREDPLMREAALIAEARGALVRGDTDKALAMLQAASRLGSRELEPEELALRVRALRAAGDDRAASEVEQTLRTRYPDHALAR